VNLYIPFLYYIQFLYYNHPLLEENFIYIIIINIFNQLLTDIMLYYNNTIFDIIIFDDNALYK